MSDARLMFTRTLRGLQPADERAEAWLRKIKVGTDVLIDPPKQPRNVQHHRLYWALVTLVWQNMDADRYPTPETLHQAIKVAAGLRTEFTLPNGTVGFIPGSIAFHRMGQAEFSAFYDRVCDLVSRHFLPGVSSEELKIEVGLMIGLGAAGSTAEQYA